MVTVVNNSNSQSVEDKIKDIRGKFKIIEAAEKESKYLKETKSFEREEENMYGEIISASENKEIKKVVLTEVYNEENTQTTSFYVWDNILFFAYHVSKAPRITGATEMEFHTTEQRFYFYQEQPIRCLIKKYVVNSANGDQAQKLAQQTRNEEVSCGENAKTIQDKYNQVLNILNK